MNNEGNKSFNIPPVTLDYHFFPYIQVGANENLSSEDLKNEMTSFDRVMTTLEHKEPDRVPFMPFAQTFTAKFAGIPFSAYVSKSDEMVEGQFIRCRY